MKNIIISIIVFSYFVTVAHAFTPAGEVMVNGAQSPAVINYSYSPGTGDEMTRSVNRLSGTVKAVKKDVSAVSKEVVAVKKDVAIIKQEVSKTQQAVTSLAKSSEEIAKLTTSTSKKVDAVEQAVKGESKNLGSLLTTVAWVLGILLVLGVIIILSRVRKIPSQGAEAILPVLNEIRDSITQLPSRTAKAVKKLDRMVIELDVSGHRVTYTPPIVEEGGVEWYVTLYVPTTNVAVADPTLITRARMTDKGAVRRATRKVMADYFAATAPGAPAPITQQEIQTIALVNALKVTPELQIA
jgi:hypothetical protein